MFEEMRIRNMRTIVRKRRLWIIARGSKEKKMKFFFYLPLNDIICDYLVCPPMNSFGLRISIDFNRRILDRIAITLYRYIFR